MSQIIRLDSFIKVFGINETRISFLLKDAQVSVWEAEGKKYVDYDDLITLIKYKCIKLKETEQVLNEVCSPLDDKLLSIKEACDYLGVSKSTLNRMRENGEVETIMVGGSPRFKKDRLYRTTG